MMIERIEALRTANIFEPYTHCRMLSRPSIKETDNGYRAQTNFNVVRTMQEGGMKFTPLSSFFMRLCSKTASRYSRTVAWSLSYIVWISCWWCRSSSVLAVR